MSSPAPAPLSSLKRLYDEIDAGTMNRREQLDLIKTIIEAVDKDPDAKKAKIQEEPAAVVASRVLQSLLAKNFRNADGVVITVSYPFTFNSDKEAIAARRMGFPSSNVQFNKFASDHPNWKEVVVDDDDDDDDDDNPPGYNKNAPREIRRWDGRCMQEGTFRFQDEFGSWMYTLPPLKKSVQPCRHTRVQTVRAMKGWTCRDCGASGPERFPPRADEERIKAEFAAAAKSSK